MAQWGGTEEADRGAPRRSQVWERLIRAILALVGLAGAGLVAGDMMGGAHGGDTGAAGAGLLVVYLVLCALIVRGHRAMKGQERVTRAEAEGEERRRRPYSVVDEAEAAVARAHGRRGLW